MFRSSSIQQKIKHIYHFNLEYSQINESISLSLSLSLARSLAWFFFISQLLLARTLHATQQVIQQYTVLYTIFTLNITWFALQFMAQKKQK